MTKSYKSTGYPKQSAMAKVYDKDERLLPKALIHSDVSKRMPSDFLKEILQFARGAESRGEWVFREEYLKPYIKRFIKDRETDSWWEDEMGNIVVHVGENPWDTLFVGHVDTVHSDSASVHQKIETFKKTETINKEKVELEMLRLAPIPKHSERKINTGDRWIHGVKHPYEYITYTTPVSGSGPRRCLGADDGCAVATMLFHIMHGLTGTYVFTRGEERGCIGTHYMMGRMDLDFTRFKRAIEIDRKGTSEIIVSMSPGITASDEFGKALADALDLGHSTSTKGSITDVGHLAKYIPECVNLAAGYWKQHSEAEDCWPKYLDLLGSRMLGVDWNALPSARAADAYTRPKVVGKGGATYLGGGIYDDEDDYLGNYPSRYVGNTTSKTSSYPKKGVHATRTIWGDFCIDRFDSDEYPDEFFKTDFAMEGWVRGNVGFIRELICALGLTFADLNDLALCGLKEDIHSLINYPEDEEEELDSDVLEPEQESEEESDEDTQKDVNP